MGFDDGELLEELDEENEKKSVKEILNKKRVTGFEMDMFEMAGVEPMVMGGMGNMDQGMDMEHGGGFMVDMPMGTDNTTVSFTVTADMVGEWEIGCFEDEGQHYDDGMKGKLIVSN